MRRNAITSSRSSLPRTRSTGDSAINPVRLFSKASAEEQILVRIDDKVNRLLQGGTDDEDVIQDLLGYLILLRVARVVQSAVTDSSDKNATPNRNAIDTTELPLYGLPTMGGSISATQFAQTEKLETIVPATAALLPSSRWTLHQTGRHDICDCPSCAAVS